MNFGFFYPKRNRCEGRIRFGSLSLPASPRLAVRFRSQADSSRIATPRRCRLRARLAVIQQGPTTTSRSRPSRGHRGRSPVPPDGRPPGSPPRASHDPIRPRGCADPVRSSRGRVSLRNRWRSVRPRGSGPRLASSAVPPDAGRASWVVERCGSRREAHRGRDRLW
jgi:hypothetical protein